MSLPGKKANRILGCSRKSMAAGQGRCLYCSTWHWLDLTGVLGLALDSPVQKDMNILDLVEGRAK